MLAEANSGQAASKEQLRKRLAYSEGQVRGIARMIEAERDCIDVLTQIAAVQAALDKVAFCVLEDHVRQRLEWGDSDALVSELLAAVARLKRRG